jgi:hypothetical protein
MELTAWNGSIGKNGEEKNKNKTSGTEKCESMIYCT